MSTYHLKIRKSQFHKDLFIQRIPNGVFALYDAGKYYTEENAYCFDFRVAPDRRNRESVLRDLHTYIDSLAPEDVELGTYTQRLNR